MLSKHWLKVYYCSPSCCIWSCGFRTRIAQASSLIILMLILIRWLQVEDCPGSIIDHLMLFLSRWLQIKDCPGCNIDHPHVVSNQVAPDRGLPMLFHCQSLTQQHAAAHMGQRWVTKGCVPDTTSRAKASARWDISNTKTASPTANFYMWSEIFSGTFCLNLSWKHGILHFYSHLPVHIELNTQSHIQLWAH